MTAPTPLQISFRGNRDYLHGTDIYNAIHSAFLERLGATTLSQIQFKIPQFYYFPLGLNIFPARSEPNANGIPEWACISQGTSWEGRLTERPEATPPGRIAFDETSFSESMVFRGQEAFMGRADRASPIEALVFLNKFLHQNLSAPSHGQQWVFSKLELNSSLNHPMAGVLSVRMESQLSGFFTKSSVRLDKEPLGFIYFSKVAQSGKKTKVGASA